MQDPDAYLARVLQVALELLIFVLSLIFFLQDCIMKKYFITLAITWAILVPSIMATSILYFKVYKSLRSPSVSSRDGALTAVKRKLADSFGVISAAFILCYIPYAVVLAAEEIMRFISVDMEKGIG